MNENGAELRDPTDFKGFKVVVEGVANEASMADVGRWLDDEHVVVEPDAVRRLAGDAARERGWEDEFSKMLAYAASKGWILEGGIRAHVERPGQAAS